MNKCLSLLSFLMVLTSCETSQVTKNDFSMLTSKVHNLESENKVLTEKIDKLSQRVILLEASLKATENEVSELKSNYRKAETAKSMYIESNATRSRQTNNTPSKSASFKSTAKKSSYSSSATYSGRCQATTKKGTQCKRNAQSGRRYCWQH